MNRANYFAEYAEKNLIKSDNANEYEDLKNWVETVDKDKIYFILDNEDSKKKNDDFRDKFYRDLVTLNFFLENNIKALDYVNRLEDDDNDTKKLTKMVVNANNYRFSVALRERIYEKAKTTSCEKSVDVANFIESVEKFKCAYLDELNKEFNSFNDSSNDPKKSRENLEKVSGTLEKISDVLFSMFVVGDSDKVVNFHEEKDKNGMPSYRIDCLFEEIEKSVCSNNNRINENDKSTSDSRNVTNKVINLINSVRYIVAMAYLKEEYLKTDGVKDEYEKYLASAFRLLKEIRYNTKNKLFLRLRYFADKVLCENSHTGLTDKLNYQLLKFVYMTFRIQYLLAVSLTDLNSIRENLGYYTSSESFLKTIKSYERKRGCHLLMMSIEYMNDPSEGKIFPEVIKNTKNSEKSTYSDSHVYLKSFTQNYDDLPMWERYADMGKGVFVQVGTNFFARYAANLDYGVNINDLKVIRLEESDDLYRVAYCVKEKDKNDINKYTYRVDDITRLSNQMRKGDGICEKEIDENCKKGKCNIDEGVSKIIIEELNDIIERMKTLYVEISANKKSKDVADYYAKRISYLFKSNDYVSEKELRILSYDCQNPIVVERGNHVPFMAAKWGKALEFKQVMFGPRVSDLSMNHYVPYVQHQIEQCNRWIYTNKNENAEGNTIVKSKEEDDRFVISRSEKSLI